MGTDFSEVNQKCLDFQDLCNIVEFIHCLPGSSAVKRIFSIMNSLRVKGKNLD